MTVLDAFAVLALLKDEPAAEPVERLVRADPTSSLTPLGTAEVLDHLVRVIGVDEDDAMLDLAQLTLAEPVPVDAEVGARAGRLRARHYHRRDRAVSLADCVAVETAAVRGVALASADPHLLNMCTAEGIEVVALPDTSGHTWTP